MLNAAELANVETIHTKLTDIELSRVPLPTVFNLHREIDQWLTGYKQDGITLAKLVPQPPRLASIKSKEKSKRKQLKEVVPKTLYAPHEVKLILGKKNILGSKSRVDLSVCGKVHTLLLLQSADQPASWFLLETRIDGIWPGALNLLSKDLFTALLE